MKFQLTLKDGKNINIIYVSHRQISVVTTFPRFTRLYNHFSAEKKELLEIFWMQRSTRRKKQSVQEPNFFLWDARVWRH